MPYALLGIFLSLILVVGCVKIPTEEACCSLQPVPSLDQSIQAALESGDFSEGEFPSGEWWEMFYDPQLSHLICSAIASNPTLQGAEARVREAEARAKVQRSTLFPTLGFDASLDWQYLGKNGFFRAFAPTIPGNIAEYEIGVDFSYEIDFWGKNRNLFRSALSEAKAREAEEQNVRLLLSTSVAAVYYKLQANKKKLQILQEGREVLTRLFELTKQREENALDNSMQRLFAEEQLFLINKNILLGEQRIALSRHMLHFLLGAGPDAEKDIGEISFASSIEFSLPRSLSSNLLARRPDLMASLWRVESAAHLVGAAKADFYPRVNLSALAGLDSVFFSKLFSLSSRTASLQPALHLPIFTGGRLKANLKEKEALFHEFIYAYNDAVLHAVKEVADEVAVLRIANERLTIEERILANKRENAKIVTHRFQHAIGSALEVLQSQDEVLQQEFSKIQAQYKRAVAAIRLVKALGGGYCTEEVPFD